MANESLPSRGDIAECICGLLISQANNIVMPNFKRCESGLLLCTRMNENGRYQQTYNDRHKSQLSESMLNKMENIKVYTIPSLIYLREAFAFKQDF